jgi:hypothetical protein
MGEGREEEGWGPQRREDPHAESPVREGGPSSMGLGLTPLNPGPRVPPPAIEAGVPECQGPTGAKAACCRAYPPAHVTHMSGITGTSDTFGKSATRARQGQPCANELLAPVVGDSILQGGVRAGPSPFIFCFASGGRRCAVRVNGGSGQLGRLGGHGHDTSVLLDASDLQIAIHARIAALVSVSLQHRKTVLC